MKLRRTTAFLAASIAVFTTFSCGSSESSTRVKNSALAKTPVLVNGSFSKSGGGWKMAETSFPVSGSCALGGDGNPSLGTHTASQLVFGRKKASVSQEIMVPEPGTVTFAVLHEIPRPRGFGDIPAKASITLSDSNERYEKTSSGAKKIEATVTTTQNNEKITIVITGIPGSSTTGCKGAAFSDATLIYAKTLPPTTTSTTTAPSIPILINGTFQPDGGGWETEGLGPVGKGCFDTAASVPMRNAASLGYAVNSRLTFGSHPSTVFQRVTVPKPGTITFTLTLAKRTSTQWMQLSLKGSEFSGIDVRTEGTHSLSLQTTSNNEVVQIRIDPITDRRGPGCHGIQVSDAKLSYVETTPVTTPPATTTTVDPNHPPCGGNVACKVGNTGPGGGLVYFVDEQQPSRYNRYFEIAPPSWNGGTSDPVLTVDEAYNKVSEGVREGSGAVTRSPWNSDADVDWRVPKISELEQIYKSPNKGGITGGEYLSSTRASLQDPTFYFFNFTTGQQRITSLANWRNEKALVRPIRRGPSPCAFGGACKVGDVGPGGGKVFYVTTKDKPIVTNAAPCNGWNPCLYMEVAPPNWSGSANDPEKLWAEPVRGCCSAVPNDGAKGQEIGDGAKNTWNIILQQGAFDSAAKATRFSDTLGWHLPSLKELYEVYLQRTKVDAPSSGEYWSSSEEGDQAGIAINFSSNEIGLSTVRSTLYKDTHLRKVRPVRAFAPACPCK